MSLIVFSKDNCVWCDRLKEYLKDESYYEFNIDQDETAAILAGAFGFKTMPQVFKDRVWIGGYTEYCAASTTLVSTGDSTDLQGSIV